MNPNKILPIEFTWILDPNTATKSLLGTLCIAAREQISFDLIANSSSSKLKQLENELKCKIEEIIKDELRKFLKEEIK